MDLFNVYPLFDIEIEKGVNCRTYDKQGIEYLDLQGCELKKLLSLHIVSRLSNQ